MRICKHSGIEGKESGFRIEWHSLNLIYSRTSSRKRWKACGCEAGAVLKGGVYWSILDAFQSKPNEADAGFPAFAAEGS
jgi:hypothetical protein